MKTIAITAVAASFIALATLPVVSEQVPDAAKDTVNQLLSEGYTIEEVETESGQIVIEAVKGDVEREIIVVADTGEVVKDMLEVDDEDQEQSATEENDDD